MFDCIVFMDDGSTRKVETNKEFGSLTFPHHDEESVLDYRIQKFEHHKDGAAMLYLIASTEDVDEGVVLEAIFHHRPQPIEWKQ